MDGPLEALVAEAAQLSAAQRLALAHRILCSIEPAPSAETETAWDQQIRERIARYDAGQEPSQPAGRVFVELDRRLRP